MQSIFLAHEAHIPDLRKRGDVLSGNGDRLRRRAAQNVGHDLDPLFQRAKRLAQIDRDQAEQPQGKEGEGDGGHRERGQERRPAKREQGLPGEQLHWASAAASSTSVS